MDISTIVNIVLCVLSFLLATISIVIVVITIRQNSKMIENSTRPYLSIYDNFTNFQSIDYYIVLKNFGQSSAMIKNFSYDVDLTNCIPNTESLPPFSNLKGTSVAPNQSFSSNIDIIKLLQQTNAIRFFIEYASNSGKVYTEEIELNLQARTDNLITKASTDGNELKIISYALQELVQKNL